MLKNGIKQLLIALNLDKVYLRYRYTVLTIYYYYFPLPIPNNDVFKELSGIESYNLDELVKINSKLKNEYLFDYSNRHSIEQSVIRAEKFIKPLIPCSLNIKEAKIADIGCGRGSNSLYFLQDKASKVVAFDINDSHFLKFTDKEVEEDLKSKIEFVKLDIVNDDVNRYHGHFDLVVMHNAFEHLSDPLKALEKISKITKPGGFFINKFGPIFNEPEGPHLFNLINIPYYHHIFPDEVIYQYINYLEKNNLLDELNSRNNKWNSVSGRTSDPYPTTNRYSLKMYNKLFRQQPYWDIKSISKAYNFRSSWALRIFRKKLRHLTAQELFTSSLTLVLKKKEAIH